MHTSFPSRSLVLTLTRTLKLASLHICVCGWVRSPSLFDIPTGIDTNLTTWQARTLLTWQSLAMEANQVLLVERTKINNSFKSQKGGYKD